MVIPCSAILQAPITSQHGNSLPFMQHLSRLIRRHDMLHLTAVNSFMLGNGEDLVVNGRMDVSFKHDPVLQM